MADIFFPLDFDTVPILTVGVPIYTISATIHNPDTNADIQLPDHVWMLVRGSGTGARAISRSAISDSKGTCFLGAGAETLIDAEYSLFFSPFLKPSVPQVEADRIRKSYKFDREAWIDLDKPTVWALPPDTSAPDRRRLLRVPAWASRRKAATGGFLEAPPKGSFGTRGFIRLGQLEPFGTKDDPWNMPLDHNWVRARIKFSFFDWRQNNQQTLPPGLVVEVRRDPNKAQGQGNTQRVGAGVSASMKDGTLYTLLEGTKEIWKECHVQFRTPGPCFIDLRSGTTPSPDTRLSNGERPPLPDDFNRLPSVWHSHGMRASFTTSPRATPAAASPATPDKVWDQLHFDLAADGNGDTTTVNFHLDDVAVCNEDGRAIKIDPAATKPPSLLDHFLKVIKPNAKAPYESDVVMVGRIVPAPAIYPVPAKTGPGAALVLQQSARLVHFEGRWHDLRDDRVASTNPTDIGKVLCLGARAAKEKQHVSRTVLNPLKIPGNPSPSLGIEMHLVDVPGVNDPETGIQLQHLLLYAPVRFDIDPARPLNPPNTLDLARLQLNESAELWSPGHPALVPIPPPIPAPAQKRYAIVPTARADRSKIITRIRTFFAESTKRPQIVIILRNDNSPLRDGRSGTGAGSIKFDESAILFPDPPEQFLTAIFMDDSAIQRDTSTFGADGDNGDQFKSAGRTFAHEIGHGMHGLVDEYVERVDVAAATGLAFGGPELPKFDQPSQSFSDWRPYCTDDVSMMVSNNVPRLRHFWHHTKNLNELFKANLVAAPYSLVHENFNATGTTTLDYTVPARNPAEKNTKPPWEAIFKDVRLPGDHGEIALFPLGEDEGAVEALFKPPTIGITPVGMAAVARMQAVVIVRSRIRFLLDPAMTPKEKFDVVSTNFQSKIYNSANALLIRFVLVPRVSTATSPFKRIAVLFQPHYSLDPAETSKADIVFDISKTATPPIANPFLKPITGGRGTVVKVMAADFNFELAWRVVLGKPTVLPGATIPDTGVIRPNDLSNVVTLVEQGLSEGADSRRVEIFP